jgi:hypothetical protein
MCGELDEDVQVDNEIFARFLQIAKHHGVVAHAAQTAMPNLEEPPGRSAYMETLFTAGLVRAVSDTSAASEGQRVDAIAAQAIAFARLAGFLAGNLPPEADLFRATIEAMTDGHAMPVRTAAELQHAHSHDHEHGHHHHDHNH